MIFWILFGSIWFFLGFLLAMTRAYFDARLNEKFKFDYSEVSLAPRCIFYFLFPPLGGVIFCTMMMKMKGDELYIRHGEERKEIERELHAAKKEIEKFLTSA